MSASLAWAKVLDSGLAMQSDGIADVYTTGDGYLTKHWPDGSVAWGTPTGAGVQAADAHYVYTSEVAKYSAADGSLIWSRPALSGRVAVAGDGSVYVLGTFQGTMDADPGPGVYNLSTYMPYDRDAYLVKLDADGQFVWARDLPVTYGMDPYAAPDMGVDAAGNVLVGMTDGGYWRPPYGVGGIELVRIDPSGNGIWGARVGGTGTKLSALAVAPDGSFAIAGTNTPSNPPGTADPFDFDPGPGTTTLTDGNTIDPDRGAFAALYGANGTLTWLHGVQPNSDYDIAATHSAHDAWDVDISAGTGDVVVAAGVADQGGAYALVRRYDSAGRVVGDQVYEGVSYAAVSVDQGGFPAVFISGTFSANTIDADPSPSTRTLTKPAGASSAGFLEKLIDPTSLPARQVGTRIGTPGSWNNSGNDFTKAFDGNNDTFFDAPTSQAYAGYDFGPNRSVALTSVWYVPRTGYEGRMVGGMIQGSDDNATWTTLATITETPRTGFVNRLTVDGAPAYRYVRYLSPDGGFGNVAELQFYGTGPDTEPPYPPLHAMSRWEVSHAAVYWTDVAGNESGYRVQIFTTPDFSGTPVATADRPANSSFALLGDFGGPGTYYARVRSFNDSGSWGYVSAGSFTVPEPTPAPTDVHFTADADTGSLTFTWVDNATDETRYTAYLNTKADFTGTPIFARDLPAGATTTSVTGLAAGTYYFRISATGPSGTSAYGAVTAVLPTAQPSEQLAGTPIGTPGSWNNSGNDVTKAFDGNTATYFDAPTPQAWVGLDLGSPHRLDEVRFVPRPGFAWRMTGGVFQGSNDGSAWTTLATISADPTAGTNSLALSGSYRYVRYLSGSEGYGNVAELQFFGTPDTTTPTPPAAPTGVGGFADSGSPSPSSIRVIWTDVASDETGYEVQASTTPDFSANVISKTTGADATGSLFVSLLPGTYYIRVRALGAGVNSAWVPAAGPVTLAPAVVSHPLTGTAIGTAGSWNNSGNDLTKAFDGNTATYFDAPVAQAWAGLDLGTPQQLTEVRFVPRPGFTWRMTGGTFQGSNDASTWTTLATLSTEPSAGSNSLPLSGSYRYVRYLSGPEGFGNVAELQFYGFGSATL